MSELLDEVLTAHPTPALPSPPRRPRRSLRWDALDAFAGCAWWNYLSAPLLLTRDGVTVTEGDPWLENGEQRRRLDVRFPPDLHTHSPRQTFHVDSAGLIRRHDYTALPVGRWAHAAHHCDDHRDVAGLVSPTRRRVVPRGPGGRPLPGPVLVALDIGQIEIEAERVGDAPGAALVAGVTFASGCSGDST